MDRRDARLALWAAIQVRVSDAERTGKRLSDKTVAAELFHLFPECELTVEEICHELERFGDATADRKHTAPPDKP